MKSTIRNWFTFDKIFFWLTVILVIVGLFIFLSASFSTFADRAKFTSILFNQIVLGLGGGIVLLLVMLKIPLSFFKKHAWWMYLVGIVLLGLVFIPQLGISHGGARRWISIFGFSFQPVEFVKYTTVIFIAAWMTQVKQNIKTLRYGLIPFLVITGLVGGLLLAQPDTDSFIIIAASALVIYFTLGARLRDVGIIFLIGIIAGGALLLMRPYLMSRIQVFFDPSRDALGSSYQVQQQLIAVGSGKAFGRGFGQSIQKFKYLPEPMGDSIFSVVGEEFGFVGSVVIILLYLLFFLRGMMIAVRIQDPFVKSLVVGIICLISFQSFLNIASNIALFPLGGLPLIFMSHGGTALAFALGAIGLVLNASRMIKTPRIGIIK